MVRRKSQARFDVTQGGRSDKSKTIIANRRHRRKLNVLREIKYLRKSVHLLIPKAPFYKIVREIMRELFPRSEIDRIQQPALEALQEAAEAYLVQFFEDCHLVTLHAKRVTLMRHDMILMRRLRGRDDVINR